MAITRLNSLAIPAGTVVSADLTYPLTTFSSTGIDDNATSTAITIDSSENIGIGTTSPSSTAGWGTLLEVSGTTNAGIKLTETDTANGDYSIGVTAGTLRVWDETTSSWRMTIDGSGFVGIGTASPTTNLDVRNNISMGDGTSVTQLSMIRNSANYIAATNASGYLVFRTGGTNERMRIDSSGNLLVGKTSNDNTTNGFVLDANGTLNIVRSSEYLMRLNRTTTDGEILRFQKGGTTVGSIGSNNSAGTPVLDISANSSSGIMRMLTSGTERMRIDSSGNVGIGVSGGFLGGGTLALQRDKAIRWQDASDGTQYADIYGSLSSALVFRTGSSSTERMRIDSSGNVGIGTASPSVASGSGLVVYDSSASRVTLRNATSGDASTDGGGLVLSGADLYLEQRESANLILSTSATERMRIDSSGNLILKPSGKLYLESSSGFSPYLVEASNALTVNTNGSERMRIDSSGNVLIGTTTLSTAKFVVYGAGSTSATNATIMYNSSGGGLFYIRNDGAFNTGGAPSSPYFNTSATAANLVVNSNGFLERSTSSARYKENIRDYDQSLSIDALRPVFFNSKNEGDDKTYAGLIAEEVHDAGFTEFVEYNDAGEPDAVFYANMVALCIKEIQDLKAEVAALKGA